MSQADVEHQKHSENVSWVVSFLLQVLLSFKRELLTRNLLLKERISKRVKAKKKKHF